MIPCTRCRRPLRGPVLHRHRRGQPVTVECAACGCVQAVRPGDVPMVAAEEPAKHWTERERDE